MLVVQKINSIVLMNMPFLSSNLDHKTIGHFKSAQNNSIKMRSATFLMIAFFVCLPLSALAGRSFQETVTVDGAYYTMSLYQDNAENMFNRQKIDMTGSHVHEFLSSHSQAAEAIEPGFKFPFYGHFTERFFVTTHGFLSFAPGLHNLMYKTQYIAPLRVKLDPGRFNDSTINYILTDDSLTIQWTNITVSEPVEHPSGGRFTFQVSQHVFQYTCSKFSNCIILYFDHIMIVMISKLNFRLDSIQTVQSYLCT